MSSKPLTAHGRTPLKPGTAGAFLGEWLGPATERMLDLAKVQTGSRVLDAHYPDDSADTWREIENELKKFAGANGFVGPCEMLVAAGVK